MTKCLTMTGFAVGAWTGMLETDAAAPPPRLQLCLLGEPLAPARVVAETPGRWWVRADIPAGSLGEGVQTFSLVDEPSGTALAHLTVIAGAEAAPDLRAEIDVMRAEIELLKRALRRIGRSEPAPDACADTPPDAATATATDA